MRMVNKSSSTQRCKEKKKKNQFPNNNASNAIKCNQHPFAYYIDLICGPNGKSASNFNVIYRFVSINNGNIRDVGESEVGHPPNV